MNQQYIIHKMSLRGSLAAQMVKNLSTMQETWVRSLGQGVTLEKGMGTHSSSLAWRILWTEAPAGYGSWSHKESDMTEQARKLSENRNTDETRLIH